MIDIILGSHIVLQIINQLLTSDSILCYIMQKCTVTYFLS